MCVFFVKYLLLFAAVTHHCIITKKLSISWIVLKKMKHRIVEHMSSSTADALGLSRAILCNGERENIDKIMYSKSSCK